jgi:hypothetical protein
MRIVGQPVQPEDLTGCMEAKPDGTASPNSDGRERQRFRVLQSGTRDHMGTYIGLKDGNLDGAFWMQVISGKHGF